MGLDEQTSPNASRKRRKTADNVDDERAIKHRASLACQSCRTRKVRCDVLANDDSSCTNCRLDEVECIVLASRRGQNRRRNHKTSSVSKARSAQATEGDVRLVHDDGERSVPVCVTFEDDDNQEDHGNGDPANPTTQASLGDDTITDLSSSTPYAGILSPEARTHTSLQQPTDVEKRTSFPAFIVPPSTQVPSEDLEYLARKGAFAIPEPDLVVEILRAYLFSVHTFMPMLDYRAFTHAVLSNHADSRVSLLLFQAVMFAGLHSLPPPIVQRLGFESPKQARVVFFNRVRLLYEFDVEPDMGTVLQSLILMSSWYSKWDSRRDTWHWTGLAYDVARRMGLHREPTTRFASEKVRRFRRRLWWSLYIRDRMIALGTRRPLRIYDTDCDVTLLSLEDFDLESLDESYQGQPLMPSVKELEATAHMCIRLAKLCVHIGRVVSSQYTTLRTQNDQDIPHTIMVVSRRDEGREEELENCDRELNAWYEEMCANSPQTVPPAARGPGPYSCSDVHWQVLNMTYQTTVNVLYRTSQKSSRSRVRKSARILTKLSQSMLRRDQLRFVGLIGVTAVIAAYLSHMLDITSAGDENDDDDMRDASTFRLYQSLEVLQAFSRIYASADAAVSFLASVSQKAGISVPMQVPDVRLRDSAIKTITASEGQIVGLKAMDEMQTTQNDGLWEGAHLSPTSHNGHLASNRQYQEQASRNGQASISNTLATQSHSVPTASHSAHALYRETNMTPVQSTSSDLFNPNFVGQSSSTAELNAFTNLESGVDNGIDLDSMLYNCDFYIDTFGFTDTRLQGL